MLRKFFSNYVLAYPRRVLLLILLAMAVLGNQARNLEVDASAETLVLEEDEDLRITREINKRYQSPDFLVITYSPKADLLAVETLAHIRDLREHLLKIDGVVSVVSILDVPLLESPPKPIKELLKDVPTLESPGIDKELARKELVNSAIYKDMLVDAEFRTTALQVNLEDDAEWRGFVNRRYELREKQKAAGLSDTERAELAQVQRDFKAHRDRIRARLHGVIAAVRALMNNYRGDADLFLGGVTMIADDLITFVKSDLMLFGAGVLIFLILTLWLIFRQVRWILLPVATCALSVLATTGLLGFFGWEVTVISSNFISLQLIITMALTIHLIVRYREFVDLHPDWEQRQLVLEAVHSMAQPCFFMVLTTIAGFSSLLLSGILPVINFGWMMATGIAVSLVLTFLVFPAVLVQLPKLPARPAVASFFDLTGILARVTERRGVAILWVSGILAVLCVAGAWQLRVENSFIDYFKDSTEISQGMQVIDRKLGGTTPFDVVLDFPPAEENGTPAAAPAPATPAPAGTEPGGGLGELDEFEKEFEAEKGAAQYWFTGAKMAEVEQVHDYLNGLPETGKVISLGTMLKVGRVLNDGEPLDNFKLALVYNELPERFRKIILDPYVSVENNQVRFSVRIRDSEPDLRRNELLHRINTGLEKELGLARERFKVTGILVLYNNMLQSLFNSQILTLGAVVAALMFMFLILFRSLRIAVIAIFPNLLSVGVVLGFMGWAGIPLDMMTITIAAISVGIAVDDTIHYIHRFGEEFPLDRNYLAAMHRCHGSIGHAMYYTSITIIIGFSILVLSNFIPSIYFGLLTGLAMVIALLAALTLLPQLILVLKPFGAEKAA